MEGEYLSLDTAKKIVEKDKEIERLKKREQECIDHYLVQCKYASEMEDKYITANNIINELEKYINETKLEEFEKEYGRRYGKTFTQAEVIICNMILNKLQELKGSDKE